MLAQCRAYVVAQSDAQNRSLVTLAERAGFGFIGTVFGHRAVAVEGERSEIAFFFVHHQLPDGAMTATLRHIRESESECIRYAPVFLVINDCPYETILKYIQFGYDDILTLPEKREVIVDRLCGQLGEHLYIQTETYLGPDRRRMEVAISPAEQRRLPDSPYVRLRLSRSIETGVQVLKQEIIGRRQVPQHTPRTSLVSAPRPEGHA